MNKPIKPVTVEECKIQASILLKSLHSHDVAISKRAAKRFQHLPEFKDYSLAAIAQTDIKRKHALSVIAIEKGFTSWTSLKCELPFIRGGFLNQWFVIYAEAKSYQKIHGGFILPYKKQFFICEAAYINNLGLNPDDPQWKLIGYDWVNPDNKPAWQKLYKQWMKIQSEGNVNK